MKSFWPTSLVSRTAPFAAVLLVLALLAGCSRESKVSRHLENAREYYADGDYEKAEIEFKNVLQLQPLQPDAIVHLGLIYFDQGRVTPVFPLLKKGVELQPDNLELRAKYGMFLLAAGKPDEARAEARFVVERSPKHAQALLLLALATVRAEDIAESRRILESLPTVTSAPVKTSLALLLVREQKLDAARELLREAIRLEPKLSEAHGALATLLAGTPERAEAEPHLKAAAESAPARSAHRVNYARFKLAETDPAPGRVLLEQIRQTTPDYLPARLALAHVYAGANQLDQAESEIGYVLGRDSTHPEAMLLRARLHSAKGDLVRATDELERARNVFPRMPEVHLQLGSTYLARGDLDRAIESLKQAVTLLPDYTEATLSLATALIRKSQPTAAATQLSALLERQPNELRAWLLLADAHRADQKLDETLKVYAKIEELAPGTAQTAFMRGLVLVQQNKRNEARAAFDQALQRAPEFLPALEQLVALDVTEGKTDVAKARVGARLLSGESAELHTLLARIQVSARDVAGAEASLKRAIALRPEFTAAYLLLANVYLAANQNERALEHFEQVIAKDPQNLPALMSAALIADTRLDHAKARGFYERVLAINPNFAPALNNLAYLLSTRLGEKEKALELAQKARELQPTDPYAADTLGWILYQRGQYSWALTLLRESADKLATSAEVQAHLGFTHYMLGNEAAAREALKKALALAPMFPGSDEAKSKLDLLEIDLATVSPAQRPALRQRLEKLTDDPVALVRLAQLYEADNALVPAATAAEAAIKLSPESAPALLRAGVIYSKQGDHARAIERLKNARRFASNDPQVAHALAQAAYATGDHPWAYSLLQEVRRTAKAAGDNPDLLFEFAQAAFAVGELKDADAAWGALLKLEQITPRARLAAASRQVAASIPRGTAPAGDRVRMADTLSEDPRSLAGFLLRAHQAESEGNAAEAGTYYAGLVEAYPHFAFGKKKLALLLARDPASADRAYELATQARAAFPDDLDLRRTIGVLLYRKADYSRSLLVLRDLAAQLPQDAEVAYLTGLAHYQLKQHSPAAEALRRALALNPASEFAADAKRALAELGQ